MNQRGFTMIEMIFAVTLLLIVMTGLARFMGTFQKGVTTASALTIATAVAQERLETIRADPRYTRLGALYATADSVFTPAPGISMTRRTLIARDQTGAPARDMSTITIRVWSAASKDTVHLTAVVAAP